MEGIKVIPDYDYKFVPEQIAIITDGVQKLCDSYEAEIQSLEARIESLEAQLAQAEDTVAQMRFENWEEIIWINKLH